MFEIIRIIPCQFCSLVLFYTLAFSSRLVLFYTLYHSRYTPPSQYDIKKSLERKEAAMVEKLKCDLPPVGGFVAITHDGWTSCATESYDTITAHFINQNWELRSAVLQTIKVEGSHTSENIAERLKGNFAFNLLSSCQIISF